MKTAEDFKRQAKKKNITKWTTHNCSICGYPCGYIIKSDKVFYDSGCDCVTYHNVKERTWEDLAAHCSIQTNLDVIKEMNEFWGFENEGN